MLSSREVRVRMMDDRSDMCRLFSRIRFFGIR